MGLPVKLSKKLKKSEEKSLPLSPGRAEVT
jgi:hypothetical protein